MSVSPRSPLWMDDDKQNLGNSPGDDGRGRLHTKISNTASEPIPVTGSIDVDVPVPLPVEVINASPIDVNVTASVPLNVEVTNLTEPLLTSGTENGQPSGTEFTFVNNRRQQILSAHDRNAQFTYADFGTKNQRITQIDYTSTTIGSGAGFTARMTLTYTLVGTRYRRDSIYWTLV